MNCRIKICLLIVYLRVSGEVGSSSNSNSIVFHRNARLVPYCCIRGTVLRYLCLAGWLYFWGTSAAGEMQSGHLGCSSAWGFKYYHNIVRNQLTEGNTRLMAEKCKRKRIQLRIEKGLHKNCRQFEFVEVRLTLTPSGKLICRQKVI